MTISDRKAREKEQRRQAILSAAEKRFAREGYHATLLDAIAEDVEISKGTIYLYFKNKEDLFFSLIDEKITQYFSHLVDCINKTDSLEHLVQTLVNEAVEHFQRNHHLIRLVMSEQVKFESPLHRNLRDQFLSKRQRYLEAIEARLAQYLPPGTALDSRSITLTIIGAIHQLIMEWLLSHRTLDLTKTKQDVIHIMLRGIRA